MVEISERPDRANSQAALTATTMEQIVMASQAYHKHDPNVITLARWLARKAYKEELRAMGRRPEYEEIGDGANVYFAKHRNELIAEARNHPALLNVQNL
jgi:hypothetical protein